MMQEQIHQNRHWNSEGISRAASYMSLLIAESSGHHCYKINQYTPTLYVTGKRNSDYQGAIHKA